MEKEIKYKVLFIFYLTGAASSPSPPHAGENWSTEPKQYHSIKTKQSWGSSHYFTRFLLLNFSCVHLQRTPGHQMKRKQSLGSISTPLSLHPVVPQESSFASTSSSKSFCQYYIFVMLLLSI